MQTGNKIHQWKTALAALLLCGQASAETLLEAMAAWPTPWQLITHPVSLTLAGMYAALLLAERLWPRMTLPQVRGWWLRGLGMFTVYFFLSSYAPLLWDGLLAEHRLFDLTAWPLAAQFVLGFLSYELVLYAWHRSLHSQRGLWRLFHRMHHSAERIDALGAFYFSLWDIIGFSFITSLALVFVVGLAAQVATWILLVLTFFAIFQHANLRTPMWLGYIVQRPENHALHHARGVHYYNFCDLSLLDMLFGTFRNSPKGPRQAGFAPGSSTRILDLHLMRAVDGEDAWYFRQRDALNATQSMNQSGA